MKYTKEFEKYYKRAWHVPVDEKVLQKVKEACFNAFRAGKLRG